MIVIKRITPINFFLFASYLRIRYQVFVKEMKRLVYLEFSIQDITAYKHYVILYKDKTVIGTFRLFYDKDNIVELERLAILKPYHSKGYASLVMKQIILMLRKHVKSRDAILRLTTKEPTVGFYRKFGFYKKGFRTFVDGEYINMVYHLFRERTTAPQNLF